MKNEYYGVYDHKESDTFRPTLERRIHKDYPVSKTLTTRDDSVTIMEKGYERSERERESSSLRIRKLTPLECLKLMGFDENDYKALVEAGLSDSAIYHCAGDSLVVTVMMGLLGVMLDADYENKAKDYIETLPTKN